MTSAAALLRRRLDGWASSGAPGTADRLARYAAQLGYHCQRGGSSLSRSQYLEVALYDAEQDELLISAKLRLSDHALPPTYALVNGAADYEVSVGAGHQESAGDWIACLAWLAQRAGRDAASLPKGAVWRRVAAELLARRRRAISRRLRAQALAEIAADIEAERAAEAESRRGAWERDLARIAEHRDYLRDVGARIWTLGRGARRTLRREAAARLGLEDTTLDMAIHRAAQGE